MMYRALLAGLELDAPCVPFVQFAYQMAKRLDCRLIGFAAAEAHAYVPGDEGGMVAAELLKRETHEIGQRLKVMKDEFYEVVGSGSHSWRGMIGNPNELLAENARAADLILLASHNFKSRYNAHRMIDAGQLVLICGRPVMVAASDLPSFKGEKILVAWKDTREARRAVVDAMPFLEKASDVLVVTIEGREARHAKTSASDVVDFLAWHSVKARSEVVDNPTYGVEEEISRRAHQLGADLVIAGGYGHSRLREWAFGGVTRSLLNEGTLHRLVSN